MISLIGCAGQLPSVCDQITEPCRLCDLSRKYNVRLEDIGAGLIIANAVAIGEGLYTKQEALEVVQALRSILDNPVSYVYFRDEVYRYVNAYPGLLEVATAYFNDIGSLTQVMYAKDRAILSEFLDQQIQGLKR